MIAEILSNEIYVLLIALGVFVFTFLICCFHFKKYGFLQAIFSLITVPMIIHGIGAFVIYILGESVDLVELITMSMFGLNSIYLIHKEIYSLTGWNWLFETGWIYMPSIVLFILSYGYSITFYKKRRTKKKSNSDDE